MEKILSILISSVVLYSNAFTQNHFNIVLPSNENYIDAVYHPLIELSKDSLIVFTATTYLSNYGGTGYISILDQFGALAYNANFLDSVNTTIIFDSKVIHNDILISGTKFIYNDTADIFWYAKLNEKLDTLWTREILTSYNRCHLRKILPLKNQKIAYCGSKDQRRPNSQASLTSHGIVVISDSLGKVLHFIEINDLDTMTLEGFYGITEDKDGNIYVCGIVKKNDFNHDALIIKLSPEGGLLWRKQIPSPDYLEGVFNTFIQKDESILFIGDSYNSDLFGEKFSVILLINMNPNGFVNWTRRIMKIYDGEIRNCLEDALKNYICSGAILPEPGKKSDGYLVKFSAKGDSIWSRTISNSDKSTEQFFNIAKASDGGFYLTGFSHIMGLMASKSWIVKVDSFGCLVPGCQNTVKSKDIEDGKIKVFEFYPKPVNEVLCFLSRITKSKEYNINICDLQGREMQSYSFQPVEAKQYIMELNKELLPGLYLLRILDDKGRVVQVENLEKM